MKRPLLKAARAALFAVCLAGFGLAIAPKPCAAQAGKPNSTQTTGMPEVPHEMTFDIINFILLVIILAYLYRKYGKVFFRARTERIRKDLEEGRKALEASQAQLAVAEQKLAKLEEEVEALKKRTEAEIDREQERARKETVEEADRIVVTVKY